MPPAGLVQKVRGEPYQNPGAVATGSPLTKEHLFSQ
jgi:hypothetical protein